MKKYYFTSLLLFGVLLSWSQSAKLKKADEYMELIQYQEAIQLYQEILAKSDDPDVKAKIAKAYYKLHDYANAELWYEQLAKMPEPNPIHLLNYGQLLQYNGKCTGAEEWYNRYLRLRPYDLRKKQLQRACAYAEELMNKNTAIYQVQLPIFNGIGEDLSPAFYKNGLAFVSMRSDSTNKNAGNFFDLYFVNIQNSNNELKYGTPERFAEGLNSSYGEGIGAFTFTEKDTEIYFTRNHQKSKTETVSRLEIIRAQNPNDSVWGNLEPVSFNNKSYSVAHPSLPADGERLYFSSNMPGGFGGRDLYFSDKIAGQWGPPVNLGPTINTESDEVYPFYQNKRLYFASDGQVGLGGMDVFFVNDLGNGDWSEVENLGAPINSSFDDFGLVAMPEGQLGYFTSNRPGGVGSDDIYSFTTNNAIAKSKIFFDLTDATTGAILQTSIITSNCKEIILVERQGNQLFIQLQKGQCCEFSFALKGYISQNREVCATEAGSIKIALQPETQSKVIVGTVFDQQTGAPLEGAMVKLLSDKCGDNVITSTNAVGQFSFPIKKACCYQLRVEKDNFFATTLEEKICTETRTGTIETKFFLQPFVAGNNSAPMSEVPEEVTTFKKSAKEYESGNPIAYVLNIYYDLGKSNIRADAKTELEKLLKILNDNPDLIVELSAHTDSKGDSRQNLPLSQRRAESVVNWLTKRGIQRDRLVAVGYGEKQLLNECDDGVPCTEEQHQLNRRTEFKVLGKVK